MSRFGWAYVNDVITGSGGSGSVPGGSDKAIQFASGSSFSGSTNFTFDYTTNTVRLTGTLYADTLIVSSSTIYKSGSTKFGDDSGDTHQFTGSIFNTVLVSGTLAAFTTITGSTITSNLITGSSLVISASVISASTYLGISVVTASGGDKAIQFASGSSFSGSTNFTFDYTTNTVRLTGTLYADNLIVSSSQILKSGSTIFGDDAGDTHQFTGSVYLNNPLYSVAVLSSSDNLYIGGSTTLKALDAYGAINAYSTLSGTTAQFTTLTGSQIKVGGSTLTTTGSLTVHGSTKLGSYGTDTHQFTGSVYLDNSLNVNAATNITGNLSVVGQISASNNIISNSDISAVGNITSLSGIVSASSGISSGGSITSATNITAKNVISGSSLQITNGGQFGSTVNVTGSVSASVNLQTAGDVTAGTNLTVNNFAIIKNGLTVTGSSIITGSLTVIGIMSANSISGDGNNITGINGANVNGVGNDWTIQLKDGNTGTLTGSSNLTFSGSTLTLTGSFLMTGSSTFINIGPTILSGNLTVSGTIIGDGSGLTNIASPKYAIFYANGVTTGSNYEIVTINANKYLQLKRRKNFPTARAIGLTDSEYGWTWLNRNKIHQLSASTENISSSNSANFIHNTSSNTTWYGGTATAPVRYRNYNLQVGQTLQVTTKISAYSVSNYDQTQAIVWLSGSVDKYVRFGVGYDSGLYATAQANIGGTTNHTITSGEAAAGIWWTVNVTPSRYSLYYNLSTSSVTPPTSGWIFSQGNTFVNASATTVGNAISVGQMLMTGDKTSPLVTSITSTGSFHYFDIQVKPQEEDGYFVPNSYYRWGSAQYDTSGTEQLIGEFDLGSTSATIDQTKLRLALADLVNNLSGDSATVTWSAVQSSSSGASSSTYYDAASVVVSGTGRYFRLWMKVTSSANTGGSIGPFPITIPIS